MPFFWGTIAKKGQVFGNPARKAAARVTNGLKFSYPGYSEMFCGFADPRHRLQRQEGQPEPVGAGVPQRPAGLQGPRGGGLHLGRVPVRSSGSQQNGLQVHAGWEPIEEGTLTDRERGS